jgi:DNA polymerase III delta subunit
MMLIATEIDKLATAAHPGSIEEEDIRQLTPGSPDQRLFRYLDATLGRNLRSALMEWQRLESGGEEPAQLVAQMLGQIELTTLASLAGSRGPDEVARDVGNVQPGRISAVMAAAKTHGPQPVISAGDAIAADRKLKSGRLRTPVDALYDIMLSGSQQAPTHHSRHRPKRD